VATRRLGAWPRDFSEAKAWRYFAASTRRARKLRSGHACRVPRRRAFGRGFDSRRLHQPSRVIQAKVARSVNALRLASHFLEGNRKLRPDFPPPPSFLHGRVDRGGRL